MTAPRVHVGLNLVFLVPGETGGVEVVARELIPALVAAAGSRWRFTAFINREAAAAGGGPWGELVPSVTLPVNARNRVGWVRGEQQYLARAAGLHGVDLMHSLANTAPAWGPFRRVVTIHDLIHRIVPEAHAGMLAHGMRVLVSLGARRADRIFADSASTRADIVRLLRVPADRVDVVPLGVGTGRRATPTAEAELRRRLDLGERPVVLNVSAKRPHKNLLRLLEAVARLPADRRPVLVLPGYTTWHEDELRERASALGIAGDVRLMGWIDAADLEGLYDLASAFVFPSLYEGFGLPVLEAMARGVPVACSDRSSLPEVAGDAALLFDPESPAEIAGAIERLLSDPAEAQRLRASGRARAARYTWKATAEATLAGYERALAPGRSAPR